MSPSIKDALEKFVCQLYGRKEEDVSDLRYELFCAKNGDIGSHRLPPSKQSLAAHILRANYQAFIWRHCLSANQDIVHGHGWKNKDGQLEIDWGYEKLVPDEILEFISCKCTKQCSVKKCCCIANKLPCTDLCNC